MFTVQSYSKFHGKWEDYAPITFKAKVWKFATPEQAERAMEQLKRDHPNDQFRINPAE